MAGITRLYGNFGDDPNKWAKAIRRGSSINMRSGAPGLAIKTKEKFLTRVSLDQLQKVANEFEKKGSSEVKNALNELTKKLNRDSDDEPEPAPLVRVKKMYNIQEGRFSGTIKNDRQDKNYEEELWKLLQKIFPEKELVDIRNYSLANKILCMAKGAVNISQLEEGSQIVAQLLKNKTFSEKEKIAIVSANKELISWLEYQRYAMFKYK